MNILDPFLNRKIKKEILAYNCIFIFGDRGCGKSSLLSYASAKALKEGRPVFSNYPIKGTYQIPMLTHVGKDGVIRQVVDKEWLYTTEFPVGSLILLDEVSTIWNARDWKQWTNSDSEFFNFIRKQKIQIILASQYYDQVDINVKRACDVSFFVHSRSFLKNSSYIEISKTQTMKVADKQKEILGKDFKKGARMVSYEVGEIPLYTVNFYRKPYYKLFDTYFVPFKKKTVEFNSWDNLITI